jgi:hypothetical protein
MMRTNLQSFAVTGLLMLLGSPVLAQSRGGFSASELGSIGGGSASKEKKQPILTKDTLDKWLQEEIPQLPMRLRAAKKGIVNPNGLGAGLSDPRYPWIDGDTGWNEKSKRYQFRGIAYKDAEIMRLEKEIKSPTLPLLNPSALTIGQVGSLGEWWRIPRCDYKVFQIIDENTAIIHTGGRVAQELGFRFFLISSLVGSLQEGQSYEKLPGAFVVEKTRQYRTALGGVSTIPVLRSYDLKPHLAKLKEGDSP